VGIGLDACLQAIAVAGYAVVHYLTRRSGSVTLECAPLTEVRPALR